MLISRPSQISRRKILGRLRAQFGRVSIERLLCGAGIMNIYRTLAEIRDLACCSPES